MVMRRTLRAGVRGTEAVRPQAVARSVAAASAQAASGRNPGFGVTATIFTWLARRARATPSPAKAGHYERHRSDSAPGSPGRAAIQKTPHKTAQAFLSPRRVIAM